MSSEMVERVARAINPAAFKSWRMMYDHCIAHGDDEQTSLKYADMAYLPGIEHARIAAVAAIEEMLEPVRKALERAGDRLGGVSIERMEGDNLAITLCSHFDDPDQETGESGWTEAGAEGCDETLNAIRAHYTAAITAALGGE